MDLELWSRSPTCQCELLKDFFSNLLEDSGEAVDTGERLYGNAALIFVN